MDVTEGEHGCRAVQAVPPLARPMGRPATRLLYLEDDHCYEADATAIAVEGNALACDRTPFYAGGGGQPPDTGRVALRGGPLLQVESVYADDDEVIWHVSAPPPPAGIAGQPVRLAIDAARREALARYHTALHVLNTIVLRDYGGWITGVEIGTDYSRIDFRLEGLSAALAAEVAAKANAVLQEDHPVVAYFLAEAEFCRRGDLLRTLTVQPPVHAGRVRVVEIQGFDAQACGGTHVRRTGEVGRLTIYRIENKGRINKRLYVRLEDAARCAPAP